MLLLPFHFLHVILSSDAPQYSDRRYTTCSLPSLSHLLVRVVASPGTREHWNQLLPEGSFGCVPKYGCFFPTSIDLPALKRVQIGEASFEGDEGNTSFGLLLSNKLQLQSRERRVHPA